MSSKPADDLSVSDIRNELERICASREFERSPQLARFLKFIVEETLSGRGDKIKGYTIATMALGRQEGFDPNSDSIVRVEARRLRESLESLYASSDSRSTSNVEIRVPIGSYKPHFIRRSEHGSRLHPHDASDKGRTETVPHPAPRKEARKLFGTAQKLAFIFAVILVLSPALFLKSPVSTASYKPQLSINLDLSKDDVLDKIAGDAISTIYSTMSRFDETIVLMNDNSHSIDYRITVKAVRELSGLICIEIVLIDLSSNKIILSLRRGIRDPGLLADVVRALTVEIVEPFGVIANAETNKDRDKFKCIVHALRIRFEYDPKSYAQSNNCLDSILAKFPNDALALSYKSINLSILATRQVESMEERRRLALEAQRLGNAARAADPQSARASQALARALFAGGNASEGFIMIERALDLNPFDPTILAEFGIYRLATGNLIEGRDVLKRVCTKSFRGPEWVAFYCYVSEAMTGTASHGVDLTRYLFNERYDLGILTRVLRALDDQEIEAARELWVALVAKDPDWQTARGRAWLRRSVPANVAAFVDHKLSRSGLTNAN